MDTTFHAASEWIALRHAGTSRTLRRQSQRDFVGGEKANHANPGKKFFRECRLASAVTAADQIKDWSSRGHPLRPGSST